MKKNIALAPGFAVDAVEYASRAGAILGIRDSGKTYTATLIAEQLLECGIPFFAFDPIGRWRFLRSPRPIDGHGFPVVVLGGAAPDLPLTPDDAPKMIRAAMKSGVSVVIDFYDVKLSKSDWRAIVRKSIETILYENEEHSVGLRHVFLEEAAEFVPQRVFDGMTYSAVEKLVRMGGNAGVGVTLINQRAEELNKAVLELCDNLLLHRQRGKNSLLSLRKWLDAGNVEKPKEIISSLADLPTGQCWAWFQDVGRPQLIKIAQKQSFDPNRRTMRAGIKPQTVDVSEFVATMKATLAGKAPAPKPASSPKEERPVKESEAKLLRETNEHLLAKVSSLEEELRHIRKTSKVSVEKPENPGPHPLDIDSIYEEIKRRALSDPGILRVLASKPEIEVKIERKKIEATTESLYGRIALLISEGFFDEVMSANKAFGEIKRRGVPVAPPSVYRECDRLAKDGFLTKENGGYQAVDGMKVNVIEV